MACYRRIAGRCTYCGAHLRTIGYACAQHQDLPALDPHRIAQTLKPLEAPPDLPVLILTRKLAA